MNINDLDNVLLSLAQSALYFSVKSMGSPTLTLNTGITNAAATDSCNKLLTD